MRVITHVHTKTKILFFQLFSFNPEDGLNLAWFVWHFSESSELLVNTLKYQAVIFKGAESVEKHEILHRVSYPEKNKAQR